MTSQLAELLHPALVAQIVRSVRLQSCRKRNKINVRIRHFGLKSVFYAWETVILTR
jgi:hypothetical protein